MTIYNFEIRGEPVAKGRPKLTSFGGHARAYTPSKTRKAEADMRSQLIAQLPAGFILITKPVNLTLQIRRMKPKSTPKRVKYPITKPDLDNYIKTILDALNSVVLRDDAQVIRIFAGKEFATEKHPPGITLMIEELEG